MHIQNSIYDEQFHQAVLLKKDPNINIIEKLLSLSKI